MDGDRSGVDTAKRKRASLKEGIGKIVGDTDVAAKASTEKAALDVGNRSKRPRQRRATAEAPK